MPHPVELSVYFLLPAEYLALSLNKLIAILTPPPNPMPTGLYPKHHRL